MRRRFARCGSRHYFDDEPLALDLRRGNLRSWISWFHDQPCEPSFNFFSIWF